MGTSSQFRSMKLKGASWACRAKMVVFPTSDSCFSGIVDLALNQDARLVPSVAALFPNMGNKSTTPCFYVINFFSVSSRLLFLWSLYQAWPPPAIYGWSICGSQILDPFTGRWRNIFETTTVNIWPTCQHKSCTCMRGRLLRVWNSLLFTTLQCPFKKLMASPIYHTLPSNLSQITSTS